MRSAILAATGIAAFAALLWYATLQQGGASCEVCVEWQGRRHCQSVVATTPEEARQRAHASACGILAGGMSDELACQRSNPARVQCQ